MDTKEEIDNFFKYNVIKSKKIQNNSINIKHKYKTNEIFSNIIQFKNKNYILFELLSVSCRKYF